jgi:hypothetical protein
VAASQKGGKKKMKKRKEINESVKQAFYFKVFFVLTSPLYKVRFQ